MIPEPTPVDMGLLVTLVGSQEVASEGLNPLDYFYVRTEEALFDFARGERYFWSEGQWFKLSTMRPVWLVSDDSIQTFLEDAEAGR